MSGWLSAFVLAQALDASSSCALFQRGYVEGNPFLPDSCRGVVAVKSVYAVGGSLLFWKMGQTHPKLTKTAIGISVGVTGTAVGLNFSKVW